MGVCATWLKVRMRERGIKVWPNRKLLPTTCALFKLKERLAEIKNMQQIANSLQLESESGILEKEIEVLRVQRMQIVRKSCASHMFTKFEAYAARINVLDPDWVA
jgi:aspartate aminotransferase-like enzyme